MKSDFKTDLKKNAVSFEKLKKKKHQIMLINLFWAEFWVFVPVGSTVHLPLKLMFVLIKFEINKFFNIRSRCCCIINFYTQWHMRKSITNIMYVYVYTWCQYFSHVETSLLRCSAHWLVSVLHQCWLNCCCNALSWNVYECICSKTTLENEQCLKS